MIVSVHCRKISGSLVTSLLYLRLRRSADSWIGVSGFLISCAMRRATSAQAAVRCAETRSVMSSKVTMKSSRPSSLSTCTLRLRTVPVFDFFRRRIQQARRGAVDDGDLARAVETDHAGADACENRFREAAPC